MDDGGIGESLDEGSPEASISPSLTGVFPSSISRDDVTSDGGWETGAGEGLETLEEKAEPGEGLETPEEKAEPADDAASGKKEPPKRKNSWLGGLVDSGKQYYSKRVEERKAKKEAKQQAINAELVTDDEVDPTMDIIPEKYDDDRNADGSFKEEGWAERESRFFKKNGYMWDMCMVLPKKYFHEASGENGKSGHDIIGLLRFAGLGVYVYDGELQDEFMVKIRAGVKTLKIQADKFDYVLALDPDALRAFAETGSEKDQIAPFQIGLVPKELSKAAHVPEHDPYDHHFAAFDTKEEKLQFYKNAPGLDHPFGSLDRIKIINAILVAPLNKGGCGFDLDRLLKNGSIESIFPLPDKKAKDDLEKEWYRWVEKPWNVPVMSIRKYFGAQIALYHAFLSHYTTYSFFLAIVAIPIVLEILIFPDSKYMRVIFVFIVAFWCVGLLENWKRKQTRFAMKWGTTQAVEKAPLRPSFNEENPNISNMKSFTDGSPMLFFDPNIAAALRFRSRGVIAFLMVATASVFAAIFAFKIIVESHQWGAFLVPAAGMVQGAFILFMDTFYQHVAIRLTEDETHRTDLEFQDSLIAKLFVFQFLNNFSSLYYIAFLKGPLQGCQSSNPEYDDPKELCISELSLQLTITFIFRLLVLGNLKELLGPWLKNKLTVFREARKHAKATKTPPKKKKDLGLPVLGVLMDTDKAKKTQQQVFETLYSEFADMADAAEGSKSDFSINKLQFIELVAKVMEMDYQRLGPKRAKFEALFATFDIDNSGSLDRREFMTLVAIMTANSMTSRLRRCFEAFDLDDSGYLDAKEVQQLFITIYKLSGQEADPDKVHQRAAEALKKLDESGDGKISKEEFMNIKDKEPKIAKYITIEIPNFVLDAGGAPGETIDDAAEDEAEADNATEADAEAGDGGDFELPGLGNLGDIDAFVEGALDEVAQEETPPEDPEQRKNKMSDAEYEAQLEHYDLIKGLFADYQELNLQFAYSTLFVVASPPLVILSFMLNYIEIRVDAYKMLHAIQRPIPTATNSIGTWQSIYLATAILSVLTNSGLLVFTIDAFEINDPTAKVWAFYGFQLIMFSLMTGAALLISDIPLDVRVQLQRSEHLVAKCVNREPDDMIHDEEIKKRLVEQGIITGDLEFGFDVVDMAKGGLGAAKGIFSGFAFTTTPRGSPRASDEKGTFI